MPLYLPDGGADLTNYYNKANILGTVTQSGGVPTGAVFEYGSNANGSYIKYADGTMICWRVVSVTVTLDTSVGALFGSPAQSAINYPVEFAAAPSFNIYGNGYVPPSTALAILTVSVTLGTATATGQWGVWRAASLASGNVDAHVVAIGRWY